MTRHPFRRDLAAGEIEPVLRAFFSRSAEAMKYSAYSTFLREYFRTCASAGFVLIRNPCHRANHRAPRRARATSRWPRWPCFLGLGWVDSLFRGRQPILPFRRLHRLRRRGMTWRARLRVTRSAPRRRVLGVERPTTLQALPHTAPRGALPSEISICTEGISRRGRVGYGATGCSTGPACPTIDDPRPKNEASVKQGVSAPRWSATKGCPLPSPS